MTACRRLRAVRRALASAVVILAGGTPAGFAADPPSIEAASLASAPVIDGVVGAEEWRGAARAEGFVQLEPERGAPSPFPTEVLVGATAESLFVAFVNGDSEPSKIAAAVTSRDGDLERDDSVVVLLDANRDRRTAYTFATNLLGVQVDGTIADNGRVVDTLWDGAWDCAAGRTPTGWTVEMAIPFKALRFAGDEAVWGVNFMRRVPRRLEVALWSGPGETEWRVASFGSLTGLRVAGERIRRVVAIPYGLATVSRSGRVEAEVGGDLRLRISNALDVDLTVNPDFALVEADVEQINLSRFELSLPEKRPFFLEGIEMYDQRIRQFYSRRIGDISAGGKLVGELAGFGVAALAARADLELGADADAGGNATVPADYSVLRVQRGILGSSTVGLLAGNRRADGDDVGSIGIDTTLFFTDTLGLTGQVLRSHGPTADGSLGWFLRPAYDSATTHAHVRYTSLDAGLKANVNAIGFLEDDDRKELDAEVTHEIWFRDSAVEKASGKLNFNRYTSQEGLLRSRQVEAEVELVLANGWWLELAYEGGLEVFEKEFHNSLTSVEVGYDDRRGRSIMVELGSGTNFDSDLRLATLDAEIKIVDAWNVGYELTWLDLDPDPEGDSTWIHVLRTSYSFTPDLFITLFVQTNSAISKENVQVIGVWRFKPPFGSLQVAYQRGASEFGVASEREDTLFTKLSWVF